MTTEEIIQQLQLALARTKPACMAQVSTLVLREAIQKLQEVGRDEP